MNEGKQAVNLIDMRAEEQEVEIDLLDLFSYYRRRIILIIGAFIIGALIAGLITQFVITPKYTATAKMYMVSSSSGSTVDLSDFNIGQSLSSDYVELVKTRPIITQVIKELGLDYTYEQMLTMLSISVVTDTRILTMSVTSADREEARDIANLLAEKAEIELPKLMDTREPHIAERAILPTHKSSPSLTRNVLLGALLAMLLVLAILTVMYLMDDTIKTAEDVEKYFGALPLTVIPEGKIEGLNAEEQAFKRKRSKKRKGSSAKSKEPSYYYVSQGASEKPELDVAETAEKEEPAAGEKPEEAPVIEEQPEKLMVEEAPEEAIIAQEQPEEVSEVEEEPAAEAEPVEAPEAEAESAAEDQPEEVPEAEEEPAAEAEPEEAPEAEEEPAEEEPEETPEAEEETAIEEQPEEETEVEEAPAVEEELVAEADVYMPKADMIVYYGNPQNIASSVAKEKIDLEESGKKACIVFYRNNGEENGAVEFFDMLRQADEELADVILTAALTQDCESIPGIHRMLESENISIQEC